MLFLPYQKSSMKIANLNRPGSCITQCTDGVSLDLLGQLPDHVDLARLGPAIHESPHYLVQPVTSFSAGSALKQQTTLSQ